MVPEKEYLIKKAEQATGLSDFGDEWFFPNIDVFIESLNSQAKLSSEGYYGAEQMITGALVNRLRHKNLIKMNPEILNETVDIKAVLTGLPRTGSTMLHRMLASAPELTSVKWYEAQNYTPLENEDYNDPSPRKDIAKDILNFMLKKIPELMSIHPMDIEQADEEVIILGQLFSSSMLESTYFVPNYANWLTKQNPGKSYSDLIEILQSLQWQDSSRKNKSWILKTPGHLMSLGAVVKYFPMAKIIMTHRDPVSTVPSYCSMESALYKMNTDAISDFEIGNYWLDRLSEWLNNFIEVRNSIPDDRFIDINYSDLVEAPEKIGAQVLKSIHVNDDILTKEMMENWINANKRENRQKHNYKLSDYGLTNESISNKFKDYIRKYL
ncbi:MAG: sulfotransferase [Hellea sp.]|nr:sulfotransferase [Hellea sp.]MDG2360894.1 sulfotransferase [Hellea sp.]|tara:strand:- start:14643 stop:15788 length:1146 start_codon:yes stop_codon:yes gene_type:complete